MDYRILFQRAAKAEYVRCVKKYPDMKRRLDAWLRDLADDAENRRERHSSKIENLPFYMARVLGEKCTSWDATKAFLKKASWGEDLLAIVDMAKALAPTCEIRSSSRPFFRRGRFWCMPDVFFDVNHTIRRIVIRVFHGLPK